MTPSEATDFETHRSFLAGLAYRMLGSVAEAEDVVQDAFLRWARSDASSVVHPRAYLARVVTRLCLDRMKSATSRREQYVGTWLPEPVVAAPEEPMADDLSIALLLTLERLSPLERAAFLLHEVFDMDYGDIARALGRSEEACRQLATRARQHVRDERPRFTPSDAHRDKLFAAFEAAMTSGDVETFAQLLADDAVLYADGGGKRAAALDPIRGKENILQLYAAVIAVRGLFQRGELERASINGMPGFILHGGDGVQTTAFEVEASGDRIVAIYTVRNPDKLRHLAS
ncbi:MAG TPA: sigma-70 family RNA polymerase sigma factor [Polyangia bacterium]